MALKNAAGGRGIIVPNSDSAVTGATRDKATRRIDSYIVNRSFMTLKLISSRICFETGGQNNTVH